MLKGLLLRIYRHNDLLKLELTEYDDKRHFNSFDLSSRNYSTWTSSFPFLVTWIISPSSHRDTYNIYIHMYIIFPFLVFVQTFCRRKMSYDIKNNIVITSSATAIVNALKNMLYQVTWYKIHKSLHELRLINGNYLAAETCGLGNYGHIL